MSIIITKIKLYNFRRFREYVIEPNEKSNILIGDNESGKSTILEAIDIVASGNNRRIESIGLENILNKMLSPSLIAEIVIMMTYHK